MSAGIGKGLTPGVLLRVILSAVYGVVVVSAFATPAALYWADAVGGVYPSPVLADWIIICALLLAVPGGALLGGWLGWKCRGRQGKSE